MAKVSISEAARLTGKSRVTIHRHIEKGKLTKEQDGLGNPVLDVAELERVYGTLQQHEQVQKGTQADSVLQLAPSLLQIENQALLDRVAQIEAERSREREQFTETVRDLRTERDRLLSVIEEQTATVKLLTDQRPKVAEPTPASGAPAQREQPKGWRGIVGRLAGWT